MLTFAPRRNASHLVWLPIVGVVIGFFIWITSDVSADAKLSDNHEAIIWPMLPGENLNHLAVMFYPDSKPLQRWFVTRTLELSRKLNPELDSNAIFEQPTILFIPKTLLQKASPYEYSWHDASRDSASGLRMIYQLQGTTISIVTPAMQAEYEDLSKRNLSLKQQLEYLNLRLGDMQAYLNQLKKTAQEKLEKMQTDKSATSQDNKASPAK